MSARREICALWSRCDALLGELGHSQAALNGSARRQLDACIDELASAVRRLVNASVLSRTQAYSLEVSVSALAAARADRVPPLGTVVRYAATLREIAQELGVLLEEGSPSPGAAEAPDEGHSDDVTIAPRADEATLPGGGRGADPEPDEAAVATLSGGAVDALAFVTSAAARGGHSLGGFSRARTDSGYQLTARCSGCGREVSIGRRSDEWWFVPMAPCSARPADTTAVPVPVP